MTIIVESNDLIMLEKNTFLILASGKMFSFKRKLIACRAAAHAAAFQTAAAAAHEFQRT